MWQSHGIAAIEERSKRPPAEGEASLRVLACGLCGNDSHIVKGEFVGAKSGVVLGHEACGRVVDVGPGVRSLQVGQRVVVDPNRPCGTCVPCLDGRTHLCLNLTGLGSHSDGLLSQVTTVRAGLCVPVPNPVPDEVAALAEPLGCVLHAFDRSALRAGEDVAIVGAGRIGLMAAVLAQLHGAVSVRVYEANPARVERARALGFDACQPNESRVQTTDVVFDSAERPRRSAYSVKIARARWTRRLGWRPRPRDGGLFRPFEVFRRELTIPGTFTNPYTTRRAVQLLGGRPRPLASACDSRLSARPVRGSLGHSPARTGPQGLHSAK